MRLTSRTAIVTGAAGGIGRVAALLFAREGAKVLVTDLEESAALRVAQEIVKDGGSATAIGADVTRADDVQRMVDHTVAELGLPQILFNNAGKDEPKKLLTDIAEEDFDHTIAVNLKGVWLVMKYVVPRMIEAGGGSIINNASVAAFIACSTASYTAAKAGVVAMSRNAAVEFSRHNIRVNALCPGGIRTPMAHGVEDDESVVRRLSLMGRMGEPDEVAKMAVFLASDDSSFITGASYMVDGGWTAMTTFGAAQHREPERVER